MSGESRVRGESVCVCVCVCSTELRFLSSFLLHINSPTALLDEFISCLNSYFLDSRVGDSLHPVKPPIAEGDAVSFLAAAQKPEVITNRYTLSTHTHAPAGIFPFTP
jgi:hypothetical protein